MVTHMQFSRWKNVGVHAGIIVILLVITLYIITQYANTQLHNRYHTLSSVTVYDRNEHVITKTVNSKSHYTEYRTSYPETVQALVIAKEDRHFKIHPGINPFSILRAIFSRITTGKTTGASTISQQTAKILLNNEQDRSILHKCEEVLYALSLELHTTKDEILSMYLNSVFLGNQAQGFNQASLLYFDTPIDKLPEEDVVRLLATLSNPSNTNPWQDANQHQAELLGAKLSVTISSSSPSRVPRNSFNADTTFELTNMNFQCSANPCTTTLDAELTETLRKELQYTVDHFRSMGVTHGSIVVIHAPTNELLAIVGTPDPQQDKFAHKINMAVQPRPIGSTMKPFIYAKGFELGLRPYTNVIDREYKYPVITNFSIYPKNYDGTYRGQVTLHSALANSLNVPTVKVLEYIGLDTFYTFLLEELSFRPISDITSYAYGIALGGLEMDLLTLSHYFTIFPNDGTLLPLTIEKGVVFTPPQSNIRQQRKVFAEQYTDLVTKILSDRATGAEQFGLKSNLDVPYHSYAVKTGTSRDFHDSWTIGYTPDFVVGVWLGNAENKPLTQLSGQSGAGSVWKRAMDIVLNSPYRSDATFTFDTLKTFDGPNGDMYGLPDDNVESAQTKLADTRLVLQPHEGDVFLYTPDTTIQLVGTVPLTWSINEDVIGSGSLLAWHPPAPGTYTITATNDKEVSETINITLTDTEL